MPSRSISAAPRTSLTCSTNVTTCSTNQATYGEFNNEAGLAWGSKRWHSLNNPSAATGTKRRAVNTEMSGLMGQCPCPASGLLQVDRQYSRQHTQGPMSLNPS
jgi:hypothetical protein